jgi:DsbE subfamily thiol:disulfide oxidoreductase
VVALSIAACAGQSSLPKVGQPAPELTLTMLDGSEAKLSDFRGKVVLVNFWATYCPPCRAEMPALETVYREVADKGGVVLAIDQKESAETVAGFVAEFGLTFPVALDQKGAAGALYGVTGIPESFIVDKDGIVRYKTIGQMDEETIRQYFSSLL